MYENLRCVLKWFLYYRIFYLLSIGNLSVAIFPFFFYLFLKHLWYDYNVCLLDFFR